MNPGAPQPNAASDGALPVFPPFLPRVQVPYHQLLRCIGRGSYGEVWLARHVLGWYRAIKIVYKHTFEEARPFAREFEGIKHFEPVSRSHPSQLAIIEVGLSEDGSYFFYAMELADNCAEPAELVPETYSPKTLKAVLTRQGRIPAAECFKIGLALATALDHLHSHELVHRDIKPSNIIFVGGVPKLADIGLVASLDATVSLVGTMGYFPPEGPGTPTADLYSLGKVLYEMGSGRPRSDFPKMPADLENCEDADAIVRLNTIVLKACHHDPAQRYQGAAELQRDLGLAAGGRSIKRENRMAKACGVAAIFLIAAFIVIWSEVLLRKSKNIPEERTGFGKRNYDVVVVGASNIEGNSQAWTARVLDAVIDSLGAAGLRVAPSRDSWVAPDDTLPFTNLAARSTITVRANVDTNGAYQARARLFGWPEAKQVAGFELLGTTNGAAMIAELCEKVLVQLGHRGSAPWREQVDKIALQKFVSFQFHERGRAALFSVNHSGVSAAVAEFRRALEIDDRYVAAWLGLAGTYRELSEDYRGPREAIPPMRQAALRAVEIDPFSYAAHGYLASIKALFDWDFSGAERLFRQEMKLAGPGQCRSGWLLRCVGRLEEARAIAECGMRTDPQNLYLRNEMLAQLWQERKLGEAVAFAQETLRIHPRHFWSHAALAELYLQQGRAAEEALRELAKAKSREVNPGFIASEACIYAPFDRAKAAALLAELNRIEADRYVPPYLKARVHCALGETNQALTQLELAVEARSEFLVNCNRGGLVTDYHFDKIRHEPRYIRIVEQIGLTNHPKFLTQTASGRSGPGRTR